MDSRYIPMTEADCRQTCATLRQMLTSRTKEITELKEKNADLLVKVSEQEKEIEALKIMVKEKYDYMTKPLTFENKEVSEQEKEIERLKKLIEFYEHGKA